MKLVSRNSQPNLLKLLTVMGSFLLLSLSTQAQECSLVANWQNAKAQKPVNGSVRDWANYFEQNKKQQKLSAYAIFYSYLGGVDLKPTLNQCLSTEDLESLNQDLHSIFLQESLKNIKSFNLMSANELISQYEEIVSKTNMPLFKLRGHYVADSAPDGMKAGFHRGARSVFMNFTDVDYRDWYIILIHELAHNIDLILYDSVEKYTFNDLALQTARAKQTRDNLSVEEEAALKHWIRHGLNRGFLAEVRAWTVTSVIYLEGLKKGFWQSIPWLDKVLQGYESRSDLKRHWVYFLAPRFYNPKDFPFKNQAIYDLLLELRQEIEANPSAINFGNLEAILEGSRH